MFRNCLAAALRHLTRNRLHALISVAGLAVGMCTALMAALLLRNQYGYDRELPGHERVWNAMGVFSPPGMAPQYRTLTPLPLAERLRGRLPEVEAISRVIDGSHRIEYDGRRWRERVHWADAEFFKALPLRTYAGDGTATLREADGLILSRSMARRFFGSDTPMGATLLIDGHPMTVRALVEDPLPNATHEARNIIASATASFSPATVQDAEVARSGQSYYAIDSGYTYIRLKAGASVDRLRREVATLTAPPEGIPAMISTQLVRVDRMNTHEGLHPGFGSRMRMLATLGAVVLLIAGLNFVNLQTARSVTRAREVAVRKAAGASRGVLLLQFLGESIVHALAAALLALALAEWLLPHVNAFLETGARLDYWREPGIAGWLLAAAVLLGVVAGAWPAFVQSGFRPLTVLRGAGVLGHGAGLLRQVLVALQFALLIALAICAGVVFQQREFALREALRMDTDQVLIMNAPVGLKASDAAFDTELLKLPGVRGMTRADLAFVGTAGFAGMGGISMGTTQTRTGESISLSFVGVDLSLFDFYGIKPQAGKLPQQGEHSRPAAQTMDVVLNETALRKFQLGPPAAAIGQTLPMSPPGLQTAPESPASAKVLAVVPDFSLSPVSEAVQPTVYYQPPSPPQLANVRLSGSAIPETLAAIDALWKRTGNEETPVRRFVSEQMEDNYRNVLRESQAFALCALIALVLSCIGLFSLTAAAAERRTKEIGIRKALGADAGNVLQLLLWQFSRPVLWANLIAWPAAAWIMHRWLEGFAYHIELPLWLFPLATVIALLVALATVSGHALLVARAKPVLALRHD